MINYYKLPQNKLELEKNNYNKVREIEPENKKKVNSKILKILIDLFYLLSSFLSNILCFLYVVLEECFVGPFSIS
jgi:hypothetical protein